MLFSKADRDQNNIGTPSKPVIAWLLASGADPNTCVASGDDGGGIKTIWASWLSTMDSSYPTRPADVPDVAEITVMLLVAGADPKLADQLPPQIRQWIFRKFNMEKTGPAKDALRTAVMILQGRAPSHPGVAVSSAGSNGLMGGRYSQGPEAATTGHGDEPGTIVMAADARPETIPALNLTRPPKRSRSVSPREGEISPPGKRLNNRP